MHPCAVTRFERVRQIKNWFCRQLRFMPDSGWQLGPVRFWNAAIRKFLGDLAKFLQGPVNFPFIAVGGLGFVRRRAQSILGFSALSE